LSAANRIVTLLFAHPRSFRRLLITGFSPAALRRAQWVEALHAVAP
jgi:hypothetical protein